MKSIILLTLTLILSAYLGYSDLRQTDTFITVGLVLAAGFVLGLFVEERPWVNGLLLGIGIPIAGFIAAANHAILSGVEHGETTYWAATFDSAAISLISIPIAIFAVYLGVRIKKVFTPKIVT